MTGVSSIGLYLPRQRVSGASGQRSVAYADEDAFTMAVEAAHRCLEEVEPLTFGGLFFASVTSPYRESQLSSAIATACDLPRDIVTADFTGSVRSGLAALTAAVRAVEAGVRKVLVVTADCRRAHSGDGAVAVVVDAKARLCRFLAAAAVAEDFMFQVVESDTGDARRSLRDTAEVVERVINEYGVGADQLAALAVGGVGDEVASRLADLVGVDAERHLAIGHRGAVGSLGSPEPLLGLAGALERAAPGDRIVVAANGQGAEAVLFEATDAVGMGLCRPPLADAVQQIEAEAAGAAAPLVGPSVWDPPRGAGEATSVLRSLQRSTRLYGTRCPSCGGVQFPEAQECGACGTREGLEPAKLAKRGCVVEIDVAGGRVTVELEGGGRIDLEPTDGRPAAVAAPVQLTFRRAAPTAPTRYAWKVRLA